ncbi:MAG: hypothetical protein WKF43_17690 [Acidimicrobiales bacterium]
MDAVLAGPVAFDLQGPDGARWEFAAHDEPPRTTIRGGAVELCLLAGRRAKPSETGLRGEGPDAGAVLELVRTYAEGRSGCRKRPPRASATPRSVQVPRGWYMAV